MDKKKSIFLRFLLIIGFLIFFYPNISDYVNSFTQTTGIINYEKALNEFDNIDIQKIKNEAIVYNRKIYEEKDSIYYPNLVAGYKENLNPFNDGMMGYLNIEKIGISLPIYHGVNEGVIQKGVGHIPGTSLPIGGISSHAALSTHSGLPSAKLFTDLHKLDIGDEFIVSTLGEDLYYKVIQKETVLPKEVDSLKVYDGKDYLTLITCTPYGINTHRLLVRGERIENPKLGADDKISQETSKKVKKNMYISLFKLVLILGLIIIIILSIIKDLILLRKEKLMKK
ncbi:class C sortase [Peptococcus simiae]|uniref:class C sortase n=1 Tax=Peptococcus simiae TaxID=1643805 RepID=UPI0039814F40